MAFVYGAVSDDRVARLERRVEMLETIILEQRNKRVWSGAGADEPAKAPKTVLPGLDPPVRCREGCLCEVSVSRSSVPYKCDVCGQNYAKGRRWSCRQHNYDACPECVGVPPPVEAPKFVWDPAPRQPVGVM